MNVAFIPVRGGSKSIPLKNIKMLCGRPLVYWTVKAACGCKAIDKVYVSTDSEIIKDTVLQFKSDGSIEDGEKIQVIGRSAESASDTASTESVMLEFAEKTEFDNIVLIQATSPLLKTEDLDQGFSFFEEDTTDSVLSVVRQKRFLWGQNKSGHVSPTNYDVFQRPRRQEFDGYLVENGAFYITSKEDLIRTKNRLSGRMKAVEMDEESFLEIDEPSDWEMIENIMSRKRQSYGNTFPHNIKMLLTDCDGCLTDGGMYYSEAGDELKKFNTKDGMAFKLLREKGILTGILTGEDVDLNRRRASKLQMDIYRAGCSEKGLAIKEIAQAYGVDMEHICYIGDDINDLEAMKLVGFSCCPSDAVEQIKNTADFIAEAKGGQGVIREIADGLLRCMEM